MPLNNVLYHFLLCKSSFCPQWVLNLTLTTTNLRSSHYSMTSPVSNKFDDMFNFLMELLTFVSKLRVNEFAMRQQEFPRLFLRMAKTVAQAVEHSTLNLNALESNPCESLSLLSVCSSLKHSLKSPGSTVNLKFSNQQAGVVAKPAWANQSRGRGLIFCYVFSSSFLSIFFKLNK